MTRLHRFRLMAAQTPSAPRSIGTSGFSRRLRDQHPARGWPGLAQIRRVDPHLRRAGLAMVSSGRRPPVATRARDWLYEIVARNRLRWFGTCGLVLSTRSVASRPVPGMTNHRPKVAGDPLYARLLGNAWSRLPVEIRDMHRSAGRAQGRATVERGARPLARLAALILRFPKTTAEFPRSACSSTSATASKPGREASATTSWSSRQFAGRGQWAGLLCDQFGPLTFAMALVAEGGRLSLALRHWCAFAIPLPMWAGSARRRLRNGGGRPLPLPRRDKPCPDRPARPLSRLARPAAA